MSRKGYGRNFLFGKSVPGAANIPQPDQPIAKGTLENKHAVANASQRRLKSMSTAEKQKLGIKTGF